ncbi:MAG: aldehyde dehydrogenase family protein [Deltaproteobacteria bacterium]|jgi:acyl-CoA reductase-like NAD-dependent aldehyde dehydrogenase|nr:aldehyde dehydrogenase family protein [Deltaproteobacteria bacterium]
MTQHGEFKTRLEEINRLADVIEGQRSNLQETAALDAGFPVKITGIEVDLAVNYLRTMKEEIPWVENGKPYGTVATIFAYDAPVVVLAKLGGSALLTDNRLRFGVSSQTPKTAVILAEICESFKAIEPMIGLDNRNFGKHCVEDKDVRVLFISGASAVGEIYRQQHRSFDKLFFAGPGGMPAAIVFEDADIRAASRFIARRAFINGGQYCTTLKKVYIHRSIYENVREKILETVQNMKVGNPFDPDIEIGPILVERTRKIVENALEKCRPANLIAGSINGQVIHPLILEAKNIQIPDLELFGPFLVLKTFDVPDDAASELVQSRYGFLLAFFGSPPAPIKALFYANFGMVHDNPDFTFTPLRLPFGGKNKSGWILERKGDEYIERDGAFLYSKELVSFDKD